MPPGRVPEQPDPCSVHQLRFMGAIPGFAPHPKGIVLMVRRVPAVGIRHTQGGAVLGEHPRRRARHVGDYVRRNRPVMPASSSTTRTQLMALSKVKAAKTHPTGCQALSWIAAAGGTTV